MRASKLYPCVVISGRAQGDALGRLRGVEVCRVVGNHGAEPSPERRRCGVGCRQWLPVLKTRLSRRQGVIVEDKGLSVAVHYRQARQRTAARRAILTVARSLDDVRVIGGKLAVNFLVPDAPHKGLALERERAQFACDTVIYVGDDETDEDVFQLDRPGRLLSIRVGQKRTSAAPYYIRNQRKSIDCLRHSSRCAEAAMTDARAGPISCEPELPLGGAFDFLRLIGPSTTRFNADPSRWRRRSASLALSGW